MHDDRVRKVVTDEEWQRLMDPHTYVGQAPQVVDEVVAMYGAN
jgi:adenylosuccinate lyase